ncbi:MAG: ABC-2 family transporter protein [Deltaproteobacteria bacterium]|nr:ABC-2 family transporter protein [Deltaproteobacteria bacterium]
MVARTLSIYGRYFLQFLKARLSYRGDFIASVLSSIVVSISGLLFVLFLVDGEQVKSLKGWSQAEVLFIYGYSFLATALFSTVAPNLYGFGDRYVIQGQFDRVLLRPLSTLPQVLFDSFNLESFGNFAVGSTVIIYASSQLGITFSFVDVLWLLVSAFSGAVILLSVFVTLASMSFLFEDKLGISAPFFNLLNFGRYPIPIFNRAIQVLLSFVVPFGFVAFYPATHFFGRAEYRLYCYATPFVALLTALVAAFAWRFGVSRYSSTGN